MRVRWLASSPAADEQWGKQAYLLQMDDFEPAPFLLKVFQNQASVTARGRHLTAEKHGGDLEEFPLDLVLDCTIDQ
jgi:hypothetical protein